MKDFIIIGGGPVGLYWAARLAQIKKELAAPINIVVIDPRSGDYRRERIVSNEAIKSISSMLSIKMPSGKDIPSEAMYIREFEKALYEYCEEKGVIFKKGTFSQLDHDSLTYKDIDEEPHKLKCDMIIDCSGSNRVVLKETNRLLETAIFKIKPLGKNPHTNHFSCYLSLKTEEAMKLRAPEEISPLVQAKQLCKLRQKYGWPNFSFPDVDIRSAKKEDGGFNYFIYYEVPDNLKNLNKEVQIEFLKDLLQLKYGFREIDFTINSFGHFQVCPHYVEQPFYQCKELPVILPGGDCQIEPDYRKGIGIESGIVRADFFLNTASSNSKGLEFSFENYYVNVAQYMNYHGSLINQFYRQRQDNINTTSLEQARKILCAASKIVEEQDDMTAIASELKLLGNELFNKPNYDGALECYLTATHLHKALDTIPTMDFITLHANACQACLKLKEYMKCVNLADEGIKICMENNLNNQAIFFKLLFRKASALSEIINKLNVSTQKEEIDTFLKDLIKTHELMKENSGESNTAFVNQIHSKIDGITSKLSQTIGEPRNIDKYPT
ncbi:hypothetical protein EP47_08300 [Legionella norrlandica]|uniref:Tryptophan halogenase n=1 Tax=Legionella norrlandica TaxID=1498499 RepID=A0A0A2SRT2_9GAMM|nr:hypothetical protein [Legionella norrlandica]KGP62406.1 hypothetical protein EP47_08300 [Legionella norrlandica]